MKNVFTIFRATMRNENHRASHYAIALCEAFHFAACTLLYAAASLLAFCCHVVVAQTPSVIAPQVLITNAAQARQFTPTSPAVSLTNRSINSNVSVSFPTVLITNAFQADNKAPVAPQTAITYAASDWQIAVNGEVIPLTNAITGNTIAINPPEVPITNALQIISRTIVVPQTGITNAAVARQTSIGSPVIPLTNAIASGTIAINSASVALTNAFQNVEKAIVAPTISITNQTLDRQVSIGSAVIQITNAITGSAMAVKLPAVSITNALRSINNTIVAPQIAITSAALDRQIAISSAFIPLTNALGTGEATINLANVSLTNALQGRAAAVSTQQVTLTAVRAAQTSIQAPTLNQPPTNPGIFTATLVRVTGTASNNSLNPFDPSGLEVVVNGALGRSATGSGLAPSQLVAVAPIGGSSSGATRRVMSAVSGTPQSAQLGKPFMPLVVQIKFANGTPAVRVPVTFNVPVNGATASLGPRRVFLPVLTDNNGIASFPDLMASGQAGRYRVSASTPSVSTPVYFELANAPDGPPTLVLISGSGQSATVNTDFSAPLKVRVTDTAQNPMAGAAIRFTVSGTSSNSALARFTGATAGNTATVNTDANGVAASPTLHANGFAGNFSAAASFTGGTSPVSASSTASFSLSNTAGAPASITVVSGSTQTATVDTPLATPLRALVSDQSGNPVANIVVSFAAPASGASLQLGSANVAQATTAADGTATLGFARTNNLPGSFAVNATAAGVAAPAVFAIANRADVPANVIALSGNPQMARIGENFTLPFKAEVRDRLGNLLPGITVSFRSTPLTGQIAGGSFNGAAIVNVVSDAAGVATSPILRANNSTGPHEVTATVLGVVTPATFALTNLVGAPATIAVDGGSGQGAYLNTTFATGLTAKVSDAQGSPLVGVLVTFSAPANGVSLAFSGGLQPQATALTDATGRAVSPVPLANNVPGSYEVEASVTGVAAPARFMLTNLVRPIPTITIQSGDAQSAPVLSNYALPLSVIVRQVNGTPLGNVAVTFTAPSTGASVRFGGMTSININTNAVGVATAPTALANALSGPFVVTANVIGAGSASFNLNNTALAVPASISVVSGSGQSANINTPFAQPLRAIVRNAANAPVAGVSVTFSAPTSGASGLFGTLPSATAVTDAMGVATAPTLTANSVGGNLVGNYAVFATVSGVATPASFMLTNTAAVGNVLSILAGNNQSNEEFAALSCLRVRVTNALSAVSEVSVTFTAPPGLAEFSSTGTATETVITDSMGIAEVCDLSNDRTVGAYTVQARSPSTTSYVSFDMAVVAGMQDVTFNLQGGGSRASGGSVSVQLINNWGNPLSRLTVTLGSSAGMSGCRFAGNSRSINVVTDAQGRASASIGCAEQGPHDFSASILGGRFFETTTGSIGP